MTTPNEETTRSISKEDSKAERTGIKGENYLFVISIDNYDYFPSLNNAVKDAEDFIKLLCARYQFDKENLIFLKNEAANRKNIVNTFDELHDKLKDEDSIIIFYSGHGHLKQTTKRGYWVPVNAVQENPSDYVKNSEVRDFMEDLQVRHALLISDSCYSSSLFTAGEFRSDLAMDELEQRKSRWAICSGEDLIADGNPNENSPFMKSILDVLGENLANKLNTGRFLDEVRNRTRDITDSLPEGGHMVGNKGGQFIFHLQDNDEDLWIQCSKEDTLDAYVKYEQKNPTGKYSKSANDKILEYQYWNKIQERAEITGFVGYLNKYAAGKFVTDAEEWIGAKFVEIKIKQAEELNEIEQKLEALKAFRNSIPNHFGVYREIKQLEDELNGAKNYRIFTDFFKENKYFLISENTYAEKAIQFLYDKLEEWNLEKLNFKEVTSLNIIDSLPEEELPKETVKNNTLSGNDLELLATPTTKIVEKEALTIIEAESALEKEQPIVKDKTTNPTEKRDLPIVEIETKDVTKSTLYVLLVAINEYHTDSKVRKLKGCINDLNAVQTFIENNYADLHPKIAVLINEAATRVAIINAFRNHLTKQAKAGDTVLFYFAGHGSYTPTAAAFTKFDSLANDETFVCYDSRLADKHDLTDKEMAVLLAEVATDVHTVVLADSCHSASVTRTGIEERAAKENQVAAFNLAEKRYTTGGTTDRTLDTYLLSKENFYIQQGDNIQIPKSKHLLMSACNRDEEAWETNNKSGLFTANLLKVLEKNSNISYADLFARVRKLVNKKAANQTPTLAPIFGFNPNTVFLRPNTRPNPKRHQITWTEKDWRIENGAIYGLPTQTNEVEEIVIGIYKDINEHATQIGTCKIDKVLLADSILKEVDFLEEGETYWGEIQSLPMAMIVSVEGDDALVNTMFETYQNLQETSPNIELIRAFDAAKYLLKVEASGMKILEKETGNLIHGISEMDEETLGYIIEVLDKLAVWERSATLQNEATNFKKEDLPFQFTLADHPTHPISEEIITLDYPKVGADKDASGEVVGNDFKLTIKNNYRDKLYVSVVHLGPHYEINALYNCAEILPNDKWIETVDAEFVITNDWEHETIDIFKIIASTELFDDYKFQQEEIPFGKIISKEDLAARSLRRSIIIRKSKKTDWFTQTITVNTIRAQKSISNQSIELNGLQIEGHPTFKADVAFAAMKAKGRSIHPTNQLKDLFVAKQFEILDFAPKGSRNIQDQSIIELSDIQKSETLKETPLILQIDKSLSNGGNLIPVTIKDGFVIPLGKTIKQANGNIKLIIDEIPEGTAAPKTAQGKRSFKRAIWFSILKMEGLTPAAFRLRSVVYKNGTPTYEVLTKKHVEEADNILLTIHGIIGNTESMLKNLEFLYQDKKYDLIIAFDYENLGTKIEDIAQKLNEALVEVGILPNKVKLFDILAHSMGGLVSRSLIEQHRKGEDLVNHLYMFGTPNGGSNFGEIAVFQRKVTGLMTLGLNFGKSWLPWISELFDMANAGVSAPNKLTETLAQMSPNSDFFKGLTPAKKGTTKYTVVAGNICEYEKLDNPLFIKFVNKIFLAMGNYINLKKPNDIAVKVVDIEAIPTVFEPRIEAARCHHMNYFEEGEGLDKLKEVMTI